MELDQRRAYARTEHDFDVSDYSVALSATLSAITSSR